MGRRTRRARWLGSWSRRTWRIWTWGSLGPWIWWPWFLAWWFLWQLCQWLLQYDIFLLLLSVLLLATTRLLWTPWLWSSWTSSILILCSLNIVHLQAVAVDVLCLSINFTIWFYSFLIAVHFVLLLFPILCNWYQH